MEKCGLEFRHDITRSVTGMHPVQQLSYGQRPIGDILHHNDERDERTIGENGRDDWGLNSTLRHF